MQFPSNVIVAIVISIIHIFISFNLRFPNKYKNKFRIYSALINFSFIIFLIGFPMFFYDIFSNPIKASGIYFEGLAILYILLFLPLVSAIIFLFGKWIVKLDTFSKLTKYIALIGPSLILVGLGIIGYYPFMLTFYGFS